MFCVIIKKHCKEEVQISIKTSELLLEGIRAEMIGIVCVHVVEATVITAHEDILSIAWVRYCIKKIISIYLSLTFTILDH